MSSRQLLRRILAKLPGYTLISKLYHRALFSGSAKYWQRRYQKGWGSGEGSAKHLAEFKAHILNDFIKQHDIKSVVEFGCGDGSQLSLIDCAKYIGFDVSAESVKRCRERFAGDATKNFYLYNEKCLSDSGDRCEAELGLSLDVVYHLVEDDVYQDHIKHLFASSRRYVIIYSSCKEDDSEYAHIRHRVFSRDVEKLKGWKFVECVKNKYPIDQLGPQAGSFADFYIYRQV